MNPEDVKLKLPIDDGVPIDSPTPDGGEGNNDIDIVVDDPSKKEEPTVDTKVTVDEPESLDIDGVIYKLDADGNAVDDTGKITYTKDQISNFSNTDDTDEDVDYVGEIMKRVNIPIADESGKPITYDNSVEGITKYIADLKEKVETEVTNSVVDKLFSTYPSLEDAYYYARSNGGSLEGFKPLPDYSNVVLSDDVEQHKALIFAERIAKGDSKEIAQRFVKYSSDEELTKEDAANALKYLSGISEQQKTARREQDKQREQFELEQTNKYLAAINNTLSSKRLKIGDEEIILPEVFRINEGGKTKQATIKDFKDYIFTPKQFKVGNEVVKLTQNQYDLMLESQKRDHNHDVLEALRRFLRNDESQLIKGAVAAQKAKEIRKLMTTKKPAKVVAGSGSGKLKLPLGN